MYHRIRESKYREEIVTFIWDFSDHINSGDTIVGTPLTDVFVSSGVDANPHDLILGAPVVTNGTIVSQRIRRGIPGTIYTVTITINTVDEDTFEDYAYLAILPLPFISYKFFLVTQLYPIEMYYESITTTVTLLNGKLFHSVDMVPEGITSAITLVSGTLFGSPLNYNMTPGEGIVSYINLISGSLIGTGLVYNMKAEGIQSYITLINGTLFGNPINYAMTTEGIESFINLISGTLT